MKNIISIILFLFSLNTIAQSKTEANAALKTLWSLDQVDSLKLAHPSWNISVTKTLSVGFTYDSVLFNAKVGEIIRTQYSEKAPKFHEKIISKGTEEACKVSYIYLNSQKHTLSEINELREQIIAQYNDGTPFLALVQKYNEDGNPTGELDWFHKGMMVDEFDLAVREKGAGQIFSVDVESNSWYYVVLKSEDNIMADCTYSIGIEIVN